ncbi:neuroblast differentiation-associated protein AHNAK isoform X2 [Myripristis murdjan]|uniref:neuroblast differentiation-associated protein AHNAK isoform X2 n=1 Tax=Myripristis murdjan TaxID=586833 RepID=UPI001176304B|nr:neuroblast differentiation-associated protein AHNAK-like isoform X2 [Myripristis murdjan]
MSESSRKGSFSEGLVLDDSEKGGVVIKGITDDEVTARSGLKEGDEIVAATVHLDHLSKDDVLKILKVLEPYDDNMKVVTKQELKAGLDPVKMLSGCLDQKKQLPVDASAESPVIALDGLNGKLNAAGGLGGEISVPSVNGDLPSLTLNTPSADSDAKLTLPTIGIAGPNVKGADLDGTIRAPDVSVSSPQLSTPDTSLEIEKPDVKTGNLKYKPPKFKMPHFNLPQVNGKTPKGEMDVSASLDAPDFSGNVKTPDLNLSAPRVDIGTADLDLNGPNVDLNGPDVDLNGPDVDLKGPGVDLKSPNTDIEVSSGKIKWPHLKLKGPKVKGLDEDISGDLSVPDAKLSTPNIDGNLSTDVDLNLPKVDHEIPDVNGQTPDLDIDARSWKINWPHRKWKKPRLHSPKADMDANLKTPDIKAPDAELNLTNVAPELPNIDVHSPDADIDIDAPSKKINWPHLNWKKPKLHSPKADIGIDADLNTPDANLSAPKIDGDISADVNTPDLSLSPAEVGASLAGPDVDLNLPGAHIDHPELDVNSPNADIEVPSGKIKWPTLKKPRWTISGPKVKGPDVDVDAISAPDLSLSAPKTDLEGPKVDIDDPNIDTEALSGKRKKFTLKMPKFGTLKGPKVDVDEPKIDSGIDTPQIDLPTVDVQDPEIDLNPPDVSLDPHSGKLKLPKLKLPKIRGPKIKGPDVEADLKTPDIDASVDLPKVDMDAPNLDLEGQNLALSAPKIEGQLDVPKANLTGPDVDLQSPEVDVPSGKFKLPKMKFPKFGSTGLKVKGPDLDVDSQGLDASVPDVDVKLPKADLTAPEANLEAPDLNLTAPQITGPEAGLDVDAPTGKFDFPSLKLPKWNFNGSKVKDLDADLKTDVDLSVPNTDIIQGSDLELKAPGLNLSAPKTEGDISMPDLDMNLPTAEVKQPDVNLEAPDVSTGKSGRIKLPTIKLPRFGSSKPKVEGPDLDISGDLNTPDAELKMPELNLATPKVEADISPPAVDNSLMKAPGLHTPNIDLSVPDGLKGPDLDLKGPGLNLSAPKTEGDISAPDLEMTLPKPDAKVPDVNLQAPDVNTGKSGKIKFPSFKLPKFGPPKPKVEGPDVDVSADLNAPDAELKMPELSLAAPDISGGLKGPDLDLKAPDLNLSSPKTEGDLSALSLNGKLPAAKLEAPDISAPQVDVNVPKTDVKGSDIQLKTPDVDTNASLGEFKMPHYRLPKLCLSTPKVEGPSIDTDTQDLSLHPSVESEILVPKVNTDAPIADDKTSVPQVDLKVPDLNASAPKLEGDADINVSVPHGDFKGPEVDVKAPNVDIDTETSKLPHFKLPKLGLSEPGIKSSEVQANADVSVSPDVKIKDPTVAGEVSSVPDKSLNKPQLASAEGEAEVKDSPKSKLRWPFKWGVKSSSNDEEESEADSETDLSNADVEVPIFKFHKLPRHNIDNVGFSDSFGILKTEESNKDYVISKGIRLPIVNATSNTGEKIDIMERLKIAKEKATEVKDDAGDLAGASPDDPTLARGGTFKVGKPESGLGLEHPVVVSSEENDKLSLSLSNMLGLNIKDQDTD